MSFPPPSQTSSSRAAFSLVEVVLAIGVFSFCILAILSLFSIGLTNAKESEDEIRAASLASSLVCRMRAAPHKDLTAHGFPFAALSNGAGGTVFEIPAGAPFYLHGDGTRAATAAEAMKTGGYAVAGKVIHDLPARVSRVSLTLWWPASTPFPNAAGKYRISTFIDTEER